MRERKEIADAAYASGLQGEYAVLRPSSCRIVRDGPHCRLAGWSGVAAVDIHIAKAASARPLWTSMICLRAWLKCDVNGCRSTNCMSVLVLTLRN